MEAVFSTQPGKASSIFDGQYTPAMTPAAAITTSDSPLVRIDITISF
jgi:hypothetical protein